MSERKPISRVIAKPGDAAALRDAARGSAAIRDFASRELGLPDNGSYRSYADVGRQLRGVERGRRAASFRSMPKQWCYPIVGCVAYRGYFVERRARRFAD
jgi:predicted aminopeptidase